MMGRAVFMTGPAVPVQADLEFLKTLVERGELRAVIGRTCSIDQIVEAHRHADTGHKVGNLVVVIGHSVESPSSISCSALSQSSRSCPDSLPRSS